MIYDDYQERFVELFSRFTSIDKPRLADYLASHNVADLLQRPGDIARSAEEFQAIKDLRELRNIYDVLKSYDRDFRIGSPRDAYQFFRAKFMDVQDKEYFSVMFLNTKNQVIDVTTTSGTLNEAHVYTREIVKDALVKNAAFLILCHNHPSGDPSPSSEDVNLTRRITKACKLVNITVHDHLIIANERFVSLHEQFGLDWGVREKTSGYTLREKMAKAQEQSKAHSTTLHRPRGEITRLGKEN